jgi:hypothetical protein
LQHKQFLPAIGNHESPYWPYDTLFVLPDSEDYYSVNYGNAHFVMLNTEMDLSGNQRDWLINDLANSSSDTTIDWIFVNFHRPPYSSGNHGSQMDVRNAWRSLFEQYDVDVVFSGHDHDYERTIPINDVVYIVTGGGGAPLRPVGSSSWTAYSESTYHFCLVKIKERKLLLKAIKPCGTVFDTLAITKIVGAEEQNPFDNIDMTISPNPFVHQLNVKYLVRQKQDISLKIYDCLGRCIKTIVDRSQGCGFCAVSWVGSDQDNKTVNAGVYFLVLEGGNNRILEKVIKIDK